MTEWLAETKEAFGVGEGFTASDAVFVLELLMIGCICWLLLVLTL